MWEIWVGKRGCGRLAWFDGTSVSVRGNVTELRMGTLLPSSESRRGAARRFKRCPEADHDQASLKPHLVDPAAICRVNLCHIHSGSASERADCRSLSAYGAQLCAVPHGRRSRNARRSAQSSFAITCALLKEADRKVRVSAVPHRHARVLKHNIADRASRTRLECSRHGECTSSEESGKCIC